MSIAVIKPVVEGLEFKDVSAEQYRVYTFPDMVVRVDNPLWLAVSKSGGHRVVVSDNSTVYIPAGWRAIQWFNHPGKGPVQF